MTTDERVKGLETICDRMLTDYLCCAEDRHILSGNIDPFATDNRPILEKLAGTRDGMRIRHHIARLRELGIDV